MNSREYERMARIFNNVFSTPAKSADREKAIAALSDDDFQKLYDFNMGILKGTIKKPSKEEMEDFIWQ